MYEIRYNYSKHFRAPGSGVFVPRAGLSAASSPSPATTAAKPVRTLLLSDRHVSEYVTHLCSLAQVPKPTLAALLAAHDKGSSIDGWRWMDEFVVVLSTTDSAVVLQAYRCRHKCYHLHRRMPKGC